MSRALDPRLLRTVPALRRHLVALAVCQALVAGLIAAQAALLASTIVAVFAHHDYGRKLADRLVLLALVGVARALLAGGQELLGARASVTVRAETRSAALAAMVRSGPLWALAQPGGRLANATGPGLEALDGYVTRALPALVTASLVPAVVIVAITVADWQSGLLLLLMLPLVPLFMALVGMTTRQRVERQYALLTRLAGHFLDLLRGLTTLTVYGQAGRQERGLRAATERYRVETMSALRIAFLSALVLDLVAALSVAVVAVDIGLRLDGGSLGLGTALLVLLLAPELYGPLRAMGLHFHTSEEGRAAAAAALDIIDEAPPSGTPGYAVADPASGSVVLSGVTVGYPGRSAPALDDVSLSVPAGELLALTGRSGAGKTTVLSLLLGFVSPATGDILVGVGDQSLPLSMLDADTWRHNVAWLPQRPFPSQLTVAAEVRLGDPAADDEAVAAVCVECRTPLPTTALGEDGKWVSAGQRRRIALARALLRVRAVQGSGGVPLMLLDEPSEDLDHETELVVAGVLQSLAGHATVIVATHSPLLASLAHRRVTLMHGRITEVVTQQPAPPQSPVPATDTIELSAPEQRRQPYNPLRIRDLARREGVSRRLATAGALAAAAGVTGLLLTASSMWLICRAAQRPNVQALAIAVVGVRLFAISRALLRYAERLSAHDAALRLLAGLRVQVFAALRRAPGAGQAGFARGDLLRRFVGDVDGVQDSLVRAFVPLVGALVTALAAITVCAALAPAAGVALGVALALAGLVVPWAAGRAAGDGALLAGLAGRRDGRSGATVEALSELVAYGAADDAVREVARLDQELARASVRPALVAGAGVALTGAAAALALPAVLFAGAAAVRSGRLSPVDLGVLAVCVLVGFEAVAPLPSAFVAWARCKAGLSRVAEVLGAGDRASVTRSTTRLEGPVGVLATALTLAPAMHAAPVLQNAQFVVAAGARLAVTGPSGCGKSTLLAALLRLTPVTGGGFRLVGSAGSVDLARVRDDDLPLTMAGSLQGDHVFDTTLRDNLRVVRPQASDDDLDEVAALAGLTAFVASLPGGWSTAAGTDGAGLSGGERQRLLLARAFLADPQVLVLDEPTAHLDEETEQAVLAQLLRSTDGRTVVMSTHRRLAPGAVEQVLRWDRTRLLPDADRSAGVVDHRSVASAP